MAPRRTPVSKLHTTQEADDRIREISSEYAEALIASAKTTAWHMGNDRVLPNHVEEARIFLRRERPHSWKHDALTFVAGGCLGIGAPGIVGELLTSSDPSVTVILVYSGFILFAVIAYCWSLLIWN